MTVRPKRPKWLLVGAVALTLFLILTACGSRTTLAPAPTATPPATPPSTPEPTPAGTGAQPSPVVAGWTRQFGSAAYDEGWGVAVDGGGNVFFAGLMENQTIGGRSDRRDVFLTKRDSVGQELWTRQFGTAEQDEGSSVAVDGVGNVYVAGHAWGVLPDQTSAGSRDAFVVQVVESRETGVQTEPAAEKLTG